MSPFTRYMMRPGPNMAVYTNSAPAASSHDNAEYKTVTLCRPSPAFGKGETIGVIFNNDTAAKFPLNVQMERPADKAGSICVLHGTGCGSY
jgi:hypothetical protein